MKKTSAICPVCSKRFNPNKSYEHIKEFHPTANDYQLAIIRDARRKCYGQSKPVKHKNAALLPHTSIFAVSQTRATKLRIA
ncbi:hypothetical protein [Arsenophonus sp.]|uniref:hypothetical protein n=1 Tax=Arsenophonus sp. TaxID=1872640 RepID=UPI00387A0B5E